MTGVDTMAMASYANLTDAQSFKVGRAMEYFSGLRMIATKDEIASPRKDHISKAFTTSKKETVMLKKKVSSGKKK
jgi:hypothetical protein